MVVMNLVFPGVKRWWLGLTDIIKWLLYLYLNHQIWFKDRATFHSLSISMFQEFWNIFALWNVNALREGDWHWANSYESGSVQVLLFLKLIIMMINFMMEFVTMIKNLISNISRFLILRRFGRQMLKRIIWTTVCWWKMTTGSSIKKISKSYS